jgi:hypothetical protein
MPRLQNFKHGLLVQSGPTGSTCIVYLKDPSYSNSYCLYDASQKYLLHSWQKNIRHAPGKFKIVSRQILSTHDRDRPKIPNHHPLVLVKCKM